ncbi:MAG: hypothetical protein M3460_01445 [Actinomycetota bacterium]|nr:hypothetical protein [Actinomycetota bacterium]
MLPATSDLPVDLAGAPSIADVVVAPCRHEEEHPDRVQKDPGHHDEDGCPLAREEHVLDKVPDAAQAN